MGLKKNKSQRKSVRFYTTCFGFREPFKILCDGTFIHHLLVNQITSPDNAISNILGARTKIFTTRCVIAELKSLGDSHSESSQAARNLFIARCDHEKRKLADSCIEEIIGQKNQEHFFVATQDTDLRRKLQKIPGVPVIFGLRNSLYLEPPSAFQREFVRSDEEKRLQMSEFECKMLRKGEKSKLTTEMAGDSSEHEGLGDHVVMTPAVTKTKTARTLGVMDKPQFKRKRAKGPNPLSCKKKKIRANPSVALNQEGKDDEAKRKRNRKRKKSSHKGIKPKRLDG